MQQWLQPTEFRTCPRPSRKQECHAPFWTWNSLGNEIRSPFDASSRLDKAAMWVSNILTDLKTCKVINICIYIILYIIYYILYIIYYISYIIYHIILYILYYIFYVYIYYKYIYYKYIYITTYIYIHICTLFNLAPPCEADALDELNEHREAHTVWHIPKTSALQAPQGQCYTNERPFCDT